ncbi:hypothetical protein ACIBJF_31190 [Streptomyces sp. NPDC050743]|uniref:hypothetical protein n=1 Tax=Streptomyces sp. NPDC050743 TaxID=3365634 RepID=UPI0037A1B3F2
MRISQRTTVVAGVVAAATACGPSSQGDATAHGSGGTATHRPSATATHVAAKPKARPKPTPSAQPSDLPRLDHQGDGLTNCVIRYRANHDTSGWAVFASRPATVELAATTTAGKTYDKTWYADTSGGKTVYVTSMDVPVPLTALKSIEGTLVDANSAHEYRCVVGPGA